MHLSKFLAVVSAALWLGSCAESQPPFKVEPITVPSGTPATGPRLSGGSGAPLILSWMEQDADGAALLYSRYGPSGWSPPATVVDGIEMFVNWADMPSVQPMSDNHIAAHWLEKSANLTYAYDVVFVQSLDGGATWSDPIRPHSDGTPTEHGFVSMWDGGDHTGLIWLDGRKMVNEASENPAVTGMTLRAASVDKESGILHEQLVDELICDCCQTDIAVAASGPVAVYRDRSPVEIRDIYVSRFINGSWLPGVPLADDNWEIPGCPVNGPSITADGDFVAAAWFTAAGDEPRVRLRLSPDGGASFDDIIEVAAGKILGRVGAVSIGGGAAAISWLQTAADGNNELVVRRYSGSGEPGEMHVIARGVGSFSVPQIALDGDVLVYAWTETSDSVNSVHSARLPVAAL